MREKFNQEKPEFIITTQPMEIQKQPLYQQMQGTYIIKPKDHLKFEEKVLEDGSSIFTISEIDPAYQVLHQNPYMKNFNNFLKIEQPLVHTFRFSKDCDFDTYLIHKFPSLDKKGFFVSANSQCEFDELNKTDWPNKIMEEA